MKKLLFLQIAILFFPWMLFSQTASITNLQVSQRTNGSGIVDIYYNLQGPGCLYLLRLELSLDTGHNYNSIPSVFLSGDTGWRIPSSNLHIIWNGKGSNNNTYNTQCKIKIIATDLGEACPGTPTVNYGGKTYHTAQIGYQCWFKENLNIGTLLVPYPWNIQQTNNGVIEKFCYGNLESNCDIYGGLYQWAEMVQYLNGASNIVSWNPVPTGNVRGICPSGWHIPSDAEWTKLDTLLNGRSIAGGKLKETEFAHWLSPNTGASNCSKFTALPGGMRYNTGDFFNLNKMSYFRSSTESQPGYSWTWYLFYDSEHAVRDSPNKSFGYSVRCLKD